MRWLYLYLTIAALSLTSCATQKTAIDLPVFDMQQTTNGPVIWPK